MAGDKAAARNEALAAIDAADDHPVGDNRPASVCQAIAVVCLDGSPDELAGARIDGDQRGIVGGHK